MGGAVMFVMLVSSMCAYGIQALLVAIDAPYLKLISFIAVIASTVQLVEMFIKRFSPVLFRALGIFLPLITTNCAVLGIALLNVQNSNSFLEACVYGLGGGLVAAMLLSIGLLMIETPLERLLGSYQRSLEIHGFGGLFLLALLSIGGLLGVAGALLAARQRLTHLNIL